MLGHALRAASGAIQFVAAAFSDSGGAQGLSYSQAVPSGKAGDVLIFVFGSNSGLIPTTPSGWTSLGIAASNARAAFYYKVAATASEANFTATQSASTAILGGVVLRFSNVRGTVTAGTVASVTAGNTVTATAVAGVLANDYVLQCYVNGGSGITMSQPTVSAGVLFRDTNAFQPSIAVFYSRGYSLSAASTPSPVTGVSNGVQIRLAK